eukprot:gene18733-24497_t
MLYRVLPQYDGKQIPYSIDKHQLDKLNKGEPVVIKETSGKAGTGTVIQDVNAPPEICFERIADLDNYYKVVPKVKSVKVYRETKYDNGTVNLGAEFTVGISLLTFGYFINLTKEPKYNTVYWVLDYEHTSDFDDNVGHWQVLPHPNKEGWSRVLYSTGVKLYPWIPNFIVTFLTNTALVESTTWVKKESEKYALEAKKTGLSPSFKSGLPDVSKCFHEDENGSSYDISCSLEEVKEAPVVIDEQSSIEEDVTTQVDSHDETIEPTEPNENEDQNNELGNDSEL